MVDLCNDTVVLFGGRDDQNRNLNETWVFEIAKLKWKSPRIRVNATSGTIPGMYKHAAVAVRDDDTPCRCKQSMLVNLHAIAFSFRRKTVSLFIEKVIQRNYTPFILRRKDGLPLLWEISLLRKETATVLLNTIPAQ
jgi:hypothetical protein